MPSAFVQRADWTSLLRTFARNFSNIDDELAMSEMQKMGVTDFVLERTCPEEHLNLSTSGFVFEEGHSGCKSQNIAITALKGSVLCQIWLSGLIKRI